jgi:cytochrome c
MKVPSFTTMLVVLALLLLGAVLVDVLLRGSHRHPARPAWADPGAVAGGNVRLGREAIVAHGCGACHVIPGIRTATGRVGPKLEDLAEQMFIAGVLANQPDNLVAWIEDPKRFNPDTAMPNLGITPEEARHMAAYLYRPGRGR